MKVLNKYWESDLCLTKIKVNEKMKTIGFDFKNNRLAIVTHDRTIYFVDIPKEQSRYIEEAECRFYWEYMLFFQTNLDIAVQTIRL